MKITTQYLMILAFSAWAGYANALPITFNIELDGVFDGLPLEAPIVGTGQVSFEDIGNGSFVLSTLTDLAMQFSLFGELFTLADNQTPAGQVLAVVSNFGSERRLQFSNTNGFGAGPYFGSIDLVNANGAYLTFQPPGFGPSLDRYAFSAPTFSQTGSYLGTGTTPIPLPGTFAILSAGLVLLTVTRGERSKLPAGAAR